MNAMPALSAVFALAGAFAAVPRRALPPAPAVRVLTVLAALALVPTLDEFAAWPVAAVVVGAAVFATPLPCLLGAAAAATAALAAPPSGANVPLSQITAAASLAAGAASLDTETGARLRTAMDPGWLAVVAGLGLGLALALLGGGQVLAWRVALVAGAERVTLPGAGLVAGITLLVTLAGSLALAANLMTPAVPSVPLRRFGERLLVLAGGLAILSAGYILYRGSRVPEMLAASAPGLSAVLLGTGALLVGLVVLIARPVSGEPLPWLARAALEARISAGLAVAAAATAGWEGYARGGSYASPTTAAAAAGALLALAVLEPTRLSLLRKSLLVVALVFVLAAP